MGALLPGGESGAEALGRGDRPASVIRGSNCNVAEGGDEKGVRQRRPARAEQSFP